MNYGTKPGVEAKDTDDRVSVIHCVRAVYSDLCIYFYDFRLLIVLMTLVFSVI